MWYILDMWYMNVDVYIFLSFVVIFSEFFELLCNILRVSPDTDPSRRDRSVSVPAESTAETATVNHARSGPRRIRLGRLVSDAAESLNRDSGNPLCQCCHLTRTTSFAREFSTLVFSLDFKLKMTTYSSKQMWSNISISIKGQRPINSITASKCAGIGDYIWYM